MEINQERKIIEKCQKGNLEEFGKLYDCYIKKIYDFVYFKTFHKETAEDIVSKVFMKALENINGFDSKKGLFSSWVYRIARNTVIDHYRTKKSDLNIDDVWGLSSGEDIECDIDSRQKLEQVQGYLKKINPEQREIVIMRVWDGLSYREIADVLGKSETSCRMAFSRATKEFREQLLLFMLFVVLLKEWLINS